MITINDYDMAIDAANKIIKGTRKRERTLAEKAVITALVGRELSDSELEEDMFSLKEIREISEYLRIYCDNNSLEEVEDY